MSYVDGFPLSPQQRFVWSQINTGIAQVDYLSEITLTIALDTVNVSILQSIIDNYVSNVELLRTKFKTPDLSTVAVQVILEDLKCPIIQQDNSDSNSEPSNQSSSKNNISFTLQKCGKTHTFTIQTSSLIADRHSLYLLACWILYDYLKLSKNTNKDANDDDVIQYADLADWLNELLEDEDSAESLAFWQQEKQKVTAKNQLALREKSIVEDKDDSVGVEDSAIAHYERVQLSPSIIDDLLSFQSNTPALSIKGILLSAWYLSLNLLSQQRDVVSVVSFDGRDYEDLIEAFGPVARAIPMQYNVSAHALVQDFCLAVEKQLDTYASHQSCFDQGVIDYSSDNSVYTDTYLYFDYLDVKDIDGKVSVDKEKYFSVERCISFFKKSDINLFCTRETNKLILEFISQHHSVGQVSIEQVRELYLSVLSELVKYPNREISALACQPFRTALKSTPAIDQKGSEGTVAQRFRYIAQTHSEHKALQTATHTMSYAELEKKVESLAAELREKGLQAQDRVVIILEKSMEFVVSMFAVMYNDAVFVPVDPSLPEKRLEQIIDDASPLFVISDKPLPISLDSIPLLNLRDCEFSEVQTQAQLSDISAQLAYIMYTSGSTGTPKGVSITHSSLLNYRKAITHIASLDGDVSMADFSNVATDLGYTAIFGALLNGACYQIFPRETLSDPIALQAQLTRHPVDCIKAVPSHFSTLMQTCDVEYILPKKLILGGETLSFELAERLFKANPSLELYNHYGPTEGTIGALAYRVDENARCISNSIPIGLPLPGISIYVVNEHDEPVKPGIVGELLLGGACLAKEYWRNPKASAEKFILLEGRQGETERFYRTGDLVRQTANGYVEYISRKDDQLKINGFRVEPLEIASAALNLEPVSDAVALPLPQANAGACIVLFVVTDKGTENNIASVEEPLSTMLPKHMLPQAVIALDVLPRTANGKIDRSKLQDIYRKHTQNNIIVEARNPTEKAVLTISLEILGLSKMSIFDDFFDRGGHSLLAMKLIARLRKQFSVDIKPADVFELRTVAQLSAWIQKLSTVAHQQTTDIKPLVSQGGEQPLLSNAQQRLWVIDQLAGKNAVYNIPVSLEIQGEVDIELLQASIVQLIDHHQMLRLRIDTDDGHPSPRILPITEFVDCLEHIAVDSWDEVENAVNVAAKVCFDLSTDHLIKPTLFSVKLTRHVLVLNIHHIVSDGWSVSILCEDLLRIYRARCRNETHQLPSLPIQYFDFAYWKRTQMDNGDFDNALSFWQEHLSEMPQLLELPTDNPRPKVQSYSGRTRTLKIADDNFSALKEYATSTDCSVFMVTYAVFALLLHRYSQQDDFAIGVPISERSTTDLENLVGLFVNMLACRVRIEEGISFDTFIQQVKSNFLQCFEHQHLPFELLLENCGAERDLSYSPLFQVIFTYQSFSLPELSDDDLKVSPYLDVVGNNTKYDICLSLKEMDDRLFASVEYNNEIFEDQTIERLLENFEALLGACTSQPESALRALPILGSVSVKELAQTQKDISAQPNNRNVFAALFERFQQVPTAKVVIEEEGGSTCHDLFNRVMDYRSALCLREVKAQDKIGVCFNDLFEQVAGILAVWSLNAVYVPLDPQLPRQRLSYIIEDSAIHTVITGSNEKLAWDAKHALVVPRTHCLTAPQELIAKLAHVDIVNTHVAYVIYTSGSTGKPKGVAVTHANLSNVLFGVKELFSIDADDLMPVLASFGFDISLFEIFLPLIAGGGVIAVDKSKILDLEYLLRRIASASLLHAVPSLMQEIIHLKNHIGNEGSSNSVVLGRLRQAFVGGDRVSPTLLEQMDNAFCDAQIIELYGPTEATIISTAYFYRKGDDSARYLLGEALPHCNIEIIDDNGQPLPFGVPGEIFISGEGISQGYIGREDITEKQFVTYSTGVGRGYKTGDLGRYLNSGEIEYLGRRDNQIKIRGFRVELGEIEAVLEQHATIEKAVVSLVSRNQAKQLVAHVLMNSALDHDVRDFVHEKLPDYMQPSTIARIDEIPLTSNGKYDRRRIQSLAEAEISKASVNDDEEKLSRQLHTDLEKELSQLACDILGIDNRNVDFGFFDVGGDSIQAIRFMTSLRQNGYAVTPQLLFQNNTLLSLAQAIEHGESTCEEKVAVCYKSEVMPLQNWFLRSDRVNRNIFTQSVLISVEEGFSVDAFEASLRALIEQHPVLASRFELEEGTWHQTIDPISNTKLQSLFDQHECCDEDDVINIYSKAQSQLDIQAGIVFKTLLLRTPEGDVKNILMLAHHLVVDTVSWQILLQQLLHNYQLALNDLPLQRSNGGQSYLQWSNWLVQDKLQSVWTESQREQESLHWVQECNAPKLQLPFDGNVECPKVGDEVHVERKLSKVLTEQLLANGQYDLETCLQACLVQQLGEWADQPKVTLLLEAHGRELLTNNLDISQAIGWFTSAYPLSFKVDAKLEKTASYVASKKKCILNSGFGFAFSVNEEQYAEGVTQSVAFNYLGRVQTAQNGLTGFTLEDTKAFDNESGEEPLCVNLLLHQLILS